MTKYDDLEISNLASAASEEKEVYREDGSGEDQCQPERPSSPGSVLSAPRQAPPPQALSPQAPPPHRHYLLFSLVLGLLMSYTMFATMIAESLLPVCHVPILNKNLPFCWSNSKQNALQPTRWEKLASMQSLSFEQLLDKSFSGSALALAFKSADMATNDLLALVRVSDLQSKDTLAMDLVNFFDEVKKTGKGLQSLSAKVNGAVDTILAVNEYALSTIGATYTAVPILSRILAPTSASLPNSTKEIVKTMFFTSMYSISPSMERLIIEAEASRTNLDKLDLHLSLLHEAILREDTLINLAKAGLHSELLTKIGVNECKSKGLENHLILLKGVGGYRARALVYRKRALARVVDTLQTLEALSADMEKLRSSPEIAEGPVPVEVHMQSMKNIKAGLEQLKEGQLRVKEREDRTLRRVFES